MRSVKALLALLLGLPAWARVDRVVILKIDGLPERLVEHYLEEPGGAGRAGRSRLPWIENVFVQNGTWMSNYYARGLSLSAPSWSILDTGRHLEIRGNSEFDRYTLRPYDYLNFFPFYIGYARLKRVDMAGVELLDENSVPLLLDRFPYEESFQGFQLLQRGVSWSRLENSLGHAFTGKPVKDLFDDWQTGFSLSASLYVQTEKELLENLAGTKVRYLDYYSGEFDHVAHLTNDPVSQFHGLEQVDSLVGRVWNAISKSPFPETTLLVLVSDHGMNSVSSIYSQGYNLVDWFNSQAGGGQHVLTNRHPLTEFKLKGLDPLVAEVITPSQKSAYLAGEAASYPTVMLDLDGNERASIGLRNNHLNLLQVLLDQILRKHLPAPLRAATIRAFVRAQDEVRLAWSKDLDQLAEEVSALEQQITEAQRAATLQPGKWTETQHAAGLDKDARRLNRQIENWRYEARGYGEYRATMSRLLAVTPGELEAGKVHMDELIPKKSLGPANTMRDLENYVAGPSPGGMVLNPSGELDLGQSLRTLNYLDSLLSIQVRNNLQAEVANRPIDFLAIKTGPSTIELWSAPDRRARVDVRVDGRGIWSLRYVPAAGFRAGLPLHLWEDPDLDVPAGQRSDWLTGWHTEREWLQAVYKTRYSNGIISVAEALLSFDEPPASVLDRYRDRKRHLREVDLIAFANDHWNFNVRGFNPGGNHGAFFQASTHSVMLFAGGGIPKGLRVEKPYDGLSLVPTILKLLGRPEPDLPGPVIEEAVR
jgi:hypothetical protein